MGQAKSRYRRVVQEQLQQNGDMRMLTRDDKEAALQILMQAFANNDGFLWTVREDDLSEEEAKARAADTARYELQWALNTAFMCGIVIGVFSDDVLVGVLVCYPPNSSSSGSMLSDMYNSMALGPAPVDLHQRDWGLKPKLRDEAWDNYAEVHHEAVMNMRPHWYVELLGVNPNFQGCGYGKRLLSIILSAADATRHPTFLETESDFNEKIYQKYGFVTLDKGEIRTSDPTIPPFRSVYLMVREYNEARTEHPKLKKTLQGVLPIGNSASTIFTKNKRSVKFPGSPTASNSNAPANKNTADCDRSVVPPM